MRSVGLRAAFVGAIAGLVAAVMPGGAAAAPGCAATPSPSDEAALTAMINQARTAQGLAKMSRGKVLRATGRRKSMAMANGADFTHAELPRGQERAAGQNIAMAPGAAAAFEAMLESPGHRQNLMGRAWRYTGVGAAADCDGMLFVTVNFMGA